MDRKAELPQIVLARRPPGCLAGCLYGGEQQAYEGADDRNDDQEFDEREGGPMWSQPPPSTMMLARTIHEDTPLKRHLNRQERPKGTALHPLGDDNYFCD
jgi:hypothetical protein